MVQFFSGTRFIFIKSNITNILFDSSFLLRSKPNFPIIRTNPLIPPKLVPSNRLFTSAIYQHHKNQINTPNTPPLTTPSLSTPDDLPIHSPPHLCPSAPNNTLQHPHFPFPKAHSSYPPPPPLASSIPNQTNTLYSFSNTFPALHHHTQSPPPPHPHPFHESLL